MSKDMLKVNEKRDRRAIWRSSLGWSHASVYFLTILIKPLPRLFYRGKINKYILFYVVHSFLYVKSPIKYQILFHSLIRILENKQYVIKTVDNTNISVRFQVSESERIGHVAREDGGYVRKKNLYECIEYSKYLFIHFQTLLVFLAKTKIRRIRFHQKPKRKPRFTAFPCWSVHGRTLPHVKSLYKLPMTFEPIAKHRFYSE